MSLVAARGRSWVAVLTLAALYYAAARLGLVLAFPGSNASPVWPPSGLAVAALFLFGRRMLAGVALGAFSANAVVFAANSASPATVLGASAAIMAGNGLEAWLGARLLRGWVDSPSAFERLSDVAKFIVVAGVASVASAAVGTATLLIGGIVPAAALVTVSFTWWIGDATGILVLTPLLIVASQHELRSCPWQRLSAGLVLLALLVALGVLVFGFPAGQALADRRFVWLFMPCIAWAAYQHGSLGVAGAALLTASMAVWGTTRGLGPFARGNLNDALIVLQTFVGLAAVTGLVLAADRRERQQLGRQGAVRRDLAIPWAVLLASLGIAVLGWHVVASDTERRAQERFSFVVAEVHDRIVNRLHANEQILRGAAGLFAASDEVTREDWHAYVSRLELPVNFPGIQAVGFSRVFGRDERDAQLRAVRAEGLAAFDLQPPGERERYSAIVYIEPFDARNRRAFGYDMLTEPIRRAAMEQARDSGRPVVSGKVTLLQEDAHDAQAGILLYHPIYRNGASVDTPARRRTELLGFAYIPLRMSNMVRNALGGASALEGVAVRLYSSRDLLDEAHELYDSGGQASPTGTPFQASRHIELPGAEWTLQVTGLPAFDAGIDLQKAQIVLIAGVGLSLLLFALVRALTMTRERALMLAEDMNVDRERATEALRNSERLAREAEGQLQAVLRASPLGIIFTDMRGQLLYGNPSYLRIAGLTLEQAQGEGWTHAIHQDDLPGVIAQWRQAAAEGRDVEIEFRYQHADGRIVWSRAISAPIADGGQVSGFVAIVEDITSRIAADAELAAKTSALERSNEELAQYAYVASHDLKEPLRTVASYSQLLLRRHWAQLDAQGQEFVELIADGARRAQALVSDLLALASVDSSAGPLQRVALLDVLEDVCQQLGAALREDGVVLTHTALPEVMGDRAQLNQLLQNLIGNAVKFRRPGAGVTVHVAAQPEAGGGWWRISVTDNGIGIDPRFHDQIFTIFKRLHRADFPGTGIGLAICKKVVERHGGRIGVESVPGQGSTFFFTIAAALTPP
ncbi:MAG TPA: CHASE domain-containing protein [Roseateles sp.]